jgi:DNA-binding MarR family transcriptional regulator
MTKDIVQQLGYLTLGTRLKRLGEQMQAETQQVLGTFGIDIPSGQFPFLAAIDRLGPLSVGELAQALGVSQPGVTRTVAQLAENDLVIVESFDGDQRRKIVRLSPKAKRIITLGKEAAWPVIENAVRDLCHDLKGPILDQLSAIEMGLASESLHSRAQKKKGRKS